MSFDIHPQNKRATRELLLSRTTCDYQWLVKEVLIASTHTMLTLEGDVGKAKINSRSAHIHAAYCPNGTASQLLLKDTNPCLLLALSLIIALLKINKANAPC
jgi:hypothetical protein